MDISHSQQGAIRIIELKGRMDAVTAPLFDKAFAEAATPEASDFVIQLNGLEYISSAGLRSILMVAKQVKALTTRGQRWTQEGPLPPLPDRARGNSRSRFESVLGDEIAERLKVR